jgi:glucose/arabinose dehydrogenase
LPALGSLQVLLQEQNSAKEELMSALKSGVIATVTMVLASCAPAVLQQPAESAGQPMAPADAASFPSDRVVAEAPDEFQGRIAVSAPNNTVRPAHREFSEELLARLRVPDGFRIEVFAQDLEEPRGMTVGPDGALYVAEREVGRVSVLRDTNGDGRADERRAVLTGAREQLRGVHDLVVHGEHMYLVTETELLRARLQPNGDLGEAEHLQDIPAGGQHPNRTLGISPDGTLFLSIGSTCNACVEPMEDHAAMHRVSADGRDREIYAEGLRNTIGFAWHPTTGHFWGLDHNSDGRGDNWPPEELNRIVEGRHYGWPFCGGERQPDHQVPADPTDPRPMTKQEFCATTEPPALTYTAHAAPMQMIFYTGDQFPAEYRHDALVTMRGSWNRNPPTGYEVVRIRFDAAGNPTRMESFASGWLLDGGTAHFGRLMGLAQGADGSVYIGDDTNGVIYRVVYGGR